MLKTNGLPMWVTIFALLVLLNGIASSMAVMMQPHEGMAYPFNLSWAGRNLGLGLAAGAAVLLKSPAAYIVAFIGGIIRDIGDLIGELGKADYNLGVVAFLVVFLIGGVFGTLAANKARKL